MLLILRDLGKVHISLVLVIVVCSETILKSYCHYNFDGNKIEILPFLWDLVPNFHVWTI